MNDFPTTSLSSLDEARNALSLKTIRELSTERQFEWIKRVFAKLSVIYGKDFAYKWEDASASAMHETWTDALAGFNGEAIAGALQACYSREKCPNLPEFIGLCRASMSHAQPLPETSPPDKPIDRSKVASMIGEVAKKFQHQSEKSEFSINGVPITFHKRWTYALILRENDGEQILHDSAAAWREVLGFDKDVTAEQALKTKREIQQ